MNKSQFQHLLEIFPLDTDDAGVSGPNFRIAIKIFIISHNLLPSVFFDKYVEQCLEHEKCKAMLNRFFEKHSLPMKANEQMIYNVHLMPEHKQQYYFKKYGFNSQFIGACLGYPELLTDKDFKLAKQKKNPFYEISYEVEFNSKTFGYGKEWITGWMFQHPKYATPYT